MNAFTPTTLNPLENRFFSPVSTVDIGEKYPYWFGNIEEFY